MDYNLKITFGGKSYLAEIDGNSQEIYSKEKLVNSSEFSDWTNDSDLETAQSLSGDDLKWWTTNLGDLFEEALSVKIEYLKLDI